MSSTKENLFSELHEIKVLIQKNDFNPSQIQNKLLNINTEISNLSQYSQKQKSSIIKSLLITFNTSSFSDFTILFITSSDNIEIIEYAGNESIFKEFKILNETEKYFYKDINEIKINGEDFRIFYESMENNNGVYTILTMTESVFFKPSKFHMLGDIIMDVIRSADMSESGVYNDLFEDTSVGISSYLASNDIKNCRFYLFKFDNIYDFFLKMGLEIIIELSETISNKLTEFFGDKSANFRFSLSEYIVILSDSNSPENRISDLNNGNIINFKYKGIVLQHRCIKIPYNGTKSVYNIFESIYQISSSNKK